jgi:hypothetical protein
MEEEYGKSPDYRSHCVRPFGDGGDIGVPVRARSRRPDPDRHTHTVPVAFSITHGLALTFAVGITHDSRRHGITNGNSRTAGGRSADGWQSRIGRVKGTCAKPRARSRGGDYRHRRSVRR